MPSPPLEFLRCILSHVITFFLPSL
jgi:hypothetical protein